MKNLNIIYLMGAGRSGTTILASLLNANNNIVTVGEMHQFLEHIIHNKKCSCGSLLNTCKVWSPITKDYFNQNKEELIKLQKYLEKIESHKRIPISFFKSDKKYIKFQEEIFSKIHKKHQSRYYLDSAKYISRALQLKKSNKLKIKIIYVVRDVRGVINSFSKQVQTNKNPLATIIYYIIINFFGQLSAWIYKKDVLKIKYEDLIENSSQTIAKISDFLEEDLSDIIDVVEKEKFIEVPHIIGGNRLKSEKRIKLRKDLAWKKNLTRAKQIIYYFLSLPFMLLNKYKL